MMLNQMQQVEDVEIVKFLEFYRKMSTLNPLTLEWLCGVVDGLNKGFAIGVEHGNEVKNKEESTNE